MGRLFKDSEPIEKNARKAYKILIADDDEEVHAITKMILNDFTFEHAQMTFLNAYSGNEAKRILSEHSDIAVVFLDVVMEENHSGLDVVMYLRKELKNKLTRIILRTGQPGEAPEETVIRDYDINDYRLKTEMTVKRLYTTLYTALRNYRDLMQIERHRLGLEKIIATSASLFEHNTLNDFLTSILTQLSGFYHDDTELVYLREGNGFVTLEQQNKPTIVAATGKYEHFVGEPVDNVTLLSNLKPYMDSSFELGTKIQVVEGGFLIRNCGKNMLKNYIFVEGVCKDYDFELIQLFLANYSVALDNFILNNMISSTQKEIIITLGEVVEKHFEETGGHVKRISEMMYAFALELHLSYAEAEMLKVASTMHDVGKIGIPDSILKKRGKLTLDEFEVIKTHAAIGYKILSKSDLQILKIAAEIAYHHHEKFDGSGYPNGIKGKNIPLNSRMLAILDVFDAMTHKRIYKDASTVEEATAYLMDQKGKHFDPQLVDVFLNKMDTIARY